MYRVNHHRQRGRREGFGAAAAFVGGLELALHLLGVELQWWAFLVLWACGATLVIWAEVWSGQEPQKNRPSPEYPTSPAVTPP